MYLKAERIQIMDCTLSLLHDIWTKGQAVHFHAAILTLRPGRSNDLVHNPNWTTLPYHASWTRELNITSSLLSNEKELSSPCLDFDYVPPRISSNSRSYWYLVSSSQPDWQHYLYIYWTIRCKLACNAV